MEIILVWILITSSSNYAGLTSYSPPVATVEDCERMRVNVLNPGKAVCVQINMVVKKDLK